MAENLNDQKTLKLIEQVKAKKLEIAQAERPNYSTNMSFRKNDSGRPINLHVEANVGVLIEIVAFLRSGESHYIQAAKELGVDKPPVFEWDGFSVNDWVADIKTRLNKIQIKNSIKFYGACEYSEYLKKLI